MFYGKKIAVKSKQNCYIIFQKVVSFVAPSGEQELTKSYKLTPWLEDRVTWLTPSHLLHAKNHNFCIFIHLLQAKCKVVSI